MTDESVDAGGTKRRGARGGLLRHRDFRLLWIGETTSKLGSSVSRIAIPLVALVTLDAGTFLVSVLAAMTWLPWLLVGLPAGAWVDRLPSRRVMLVCNGVSLISFLSVPVAAWLDVLTIGQMMFVALAAGTAAVFFETAYQVYLPSLVGQKDLAEGNAKLQGSAAAADIAGPGLGGLITQTVGAVWGMFADALSFLVSSICLLSIRQDEERRSASARSNSGLRQEIAEGLRFVIRDRYLRVFTLYGAAANLALNGFTAVLVVFLVRELGVGAGAAGVAMAGISVGGVLGAAVAPWVIRRFGSAHGLLIGQTAMPFALLIPMGGPGFGLLLVVVGGLMISLGVMVGNVIKGSFRQSYCPRPMLGRVVVSMQFLNYGAIPVGAVLGGVMSTAFGLRATVWVTASAFALTSLILVFSPIRRHRDLPTAPADQLPSALPVRTDPVS
ncbi:MFS transporter [Streptomyces sp. NPDC001595]|uniref:MFS transporter n=1 Tax=Streptomyces sp. NPDC001532 TaxID=3154520 RepID=UPI003328D157